MTLVNGGDVFPLGFELVALPHHVTQDVSEEHKTLNQHFFFFFFFFIVSSL